MRFLHNILAKAGLIVDGVTQLNTIANATIDTDKFLVSDGGVIKYRTGAQLGSDIGAANLAASTLKHQVKLGEAINKGQAVYVSSADGTNMIVSKASNASEPTSSKTLGLIETSGVLNDQVNVVTEGLLAGLDTSTAAAGDPVWLGTGGNLIFGLANKPYAPAHLVFIGIVTRVQQNNGEIFVKVQNGFELKEIHDVQITTTPSDNTVLAYETATSLYKMKSIATLLGYTPANAARQLTINGTTYDLTADRTWSVGTVTSIATTGPITGGTITGSGTIGITQATTSSNGYLSSTDWNTFNNKQNALTLTTTGSSGASTLVGATLNIPTYSLSGLGGVPSSRQLTINGTAYDLSADRSWSVGTVTSVGVSAPTGLSVSNTPVTGSGTIAISFTAGYSIPTTASQTNWDTAYNNRITSLTTTGTSGAATLTSNTLNIPQYQAQGNYITSLTGEATASGPGAASVTLTNSAVIGKVLTGLNVTGGSISATDSILTAFGKLQNQVNGLAGGVTYQGTWNASTNSPSLTSSVGTKGYYYVVSVAGSTNLNGITDWKLGDWAIFNGTSWEKVDNTDAVVSVNGFTGAVSLTTANISESGNLYFTDARARAAISLTTTGSSGAATYSSATGVFNIPQYTLSGLGGEPTIAAGTTSQYWRGDKSWQTLNTTAVTEGTNLYYTDARSRAALSFVAGSGGYNSSTGVITIPTNTNQLTNGAGFITGNQTITISGDASGSGSTSISLTLTNSGVTAGTYTKVTVDTKGRVTSGTTLSAGDIPTLNQNTTGSAGSLASQGAYANSAPGTTRGPAGLSLREVYVNGYPTTYGNILHMYGSGAGQLLIGWSGTDGATVDNYIRSKRDNDAGAWSSWAKIWTDQNLTNLNQLTNGPGYITGNQSITLSGDASGSGTTSISVTLANSGVAAGTYGGNNSIPSLVIDAKGRITSASTVTPSGTWGISITGNAATASNSTQFNGLNFNGTGGRYQSDLNLLGLSGTSGIYNIGSGYTNGPAGDLYGTLFGIWNTDISVQFWATYNGHFYWRKSVGNTYTGSTWKTILDSSNYNSYAPTLTGGGASGTWNINISGTAGSETLTTVTSRGNSTTDRINVRGIGNQGGGNIMMGNTGEGTSKWSYLTGTHYNATSQSQGFALIGGLSTSTSNSVVIGGNIYETNPATEIQFWTHTATTHNLGGTQRGVINSSGNWGIGNLSPTYRLDVGTPNDNAIRIINSAGSNNNGIALSVGSGTPWIDFWGSSFDIKYNTSPGSWNGGNNRYVTITSGGSVGLTNTNPAYRLHVAGDIYADGGWLRVSGQSGLYFETYGGGWNMSDTTWIRSYNSKSVYLGNGIIRTDAGDLGFQNLGTANWYMLDFGDRSASSGRYGVGLTSDVNNRTLSFHVPNHAAYSSSGNVPQFGWYSNGADQLMTLQSATGNLWTKGTISMAGNIVATQSWVQSQGYVTGGPYLPLSGGTMTGALAINSTAQAFTNVTLRNTTSATAMPTQLFLYMEARYNSGANGTNIYHWIRDSWEYNITNNYSDVTIGAFGNGTTYGAHFRVSTDGQVYATNSFRAPIFYDTDNTAYYGNFAGTSVMNSIRFGTSTNNTILSGNSDWGVRFSNDVGYIQIGPANGSYAHIYTDRGSFYMNVNDLYLNGNLVPAYGYNRTGDLYASRYYDSNDTGYYGDFAGTSNINIINAQGLATANALYFAGAYGNTYNSDAMYMQGRYISSNVQALDIYIGDDGRNSVLPLPTGGQDGSVDSLCIRATNDGIHHIFDSAGDAWHARHLYVPNGNLTVGGTITEQSSLRFKENVAPIEEALSKVDKLNAVSYNKIGSKENEIGLIAEDVFNVYPEFVLCDESGKPLGIHYSRLTAVLIESVKELKKEINQLKNKN